MFRLVLRDYRLQYRESIKNVNAAGYFIYIYLLCYVPDWTNMIDALWKGGCFYAFFLPLCIGIFLSRLYPNQMSKTLLLCPLSRQQKEKYIRTGFFIRVLVPFLLFLIFEGSAMIVTFRQQHLNTSELWLWAGLTWLLFVSLISVNIYCLPVNLSPEALYRTYKLPGNYEIWNVLVQLTAILGGVIMLSALTDQKGETVFDITVEIFILVISTALCIKMIATYAGPIMEQAIFYEYRPPVQKERKRA